MQLFYNHNDTICAVATPPGMGAIAVLRLSGKDAIGTIQKFIKNKNITDKPGYSAIFASLTNPETDEILDEVVITLFRAPASYTGEDVVEISCHGSIYIQQLLLQQFVKHGCRLAQPGEFTMRAFTHGKLDLSRAEAVADLISGENEKAHKAALGQMRGGVSKEIEILRQQLIDFAALIELELDFAEEDVEFANREHLYKLIDEIITKSEKLIDTFHYGNAIKNGIPTVIAGKPNAGKSTLLNVLLNEDRALVSDIAGTTRDTIEENIIIDGINFRLIDTAGIRQHAEAIEGMGIERTIEKISEASVVLYVFDINDTTPELLEKETSHLLLENKYIIWLANKCDACNDIETKLSAFKNYNNILPISSKTGEGIEQLKTALAAALPHKPNENDVVLTNARHVTSLQETIQCLQTVKAGFQNNISGELVAFDIREAIQHLGNITGAITSDDLLGSIFTRFCIGK